MHAVYLSPATQENEYATGGNEEFYMNLIADAMVPYLRANGFEEVDRITRQLYRNADDMAGRTAEISVSRYYDLP